ncbi:DUF4328 domain-containing protein [Streptomyces sp. KPB2]|nr:DUF4328 domain-containing protein [Streptomyces sp. KPB2]MBH5131139.1 DUF4328 domain-containing protein [Streptomyces sp. HB-N217]QKW65440.1 DUF4328 domain-containing protein [Streptomyces sp. NA03103]
MEDDRVNDEGRTPALQSLTGAARCATVALALAGVAWAARGVWQIRLAVAGQPLSGPPDQGGGQHRPLTALEDAYHLVSTAGDVTTVLCAVAFLAWLSRARDNARLLSGGRLRYSSPWVYLGWIVPVANLWVPRGVVADVHRAGARDTRLPRVVTIWWVLWLVGLLSGVGLMYADSTDEVIARAYTGVAPLLVADAAVVGAAVACGLMVRALTGAQEKRAAA